MNRADRNTFYHRLVIGVSLSDILASIGFGLSTWPFPVEYNDANFSIGTEGTCRAQGFLVQAAGIASPLYNVSLSFYYLLAIKYAWKDPQFCRWRFLFHIVPILWAIVTGVASILLDILHTATLWCWIGPNPNIVGHDDSSLYRMIFFYGPVWIGIFLVTLNLTMVFGYVHKLTVKADHNLSVWKNSRTKENIANNNDIANVPVMNFVNEENDDLYHNQGFTKKGKMMADRIPSEFDEAVDEEGGNSMAFSKDSKSHFDDVAINQRMEAVRSFAKRRKLVARQCFRFALAFIITWIPITTARIMQLVGHEVPFCLLIISATITPLQGLPNFLVFLFPVLKKKLNNSRLACTIRTLRTERNNASSMQSSRCAEASASRQMIVRYELDFSQHRGVIVEPFYELDLSSSMEGKDAIVSNFNENKDSIVSKSSESKNTGSLK